MNRGYDWYGVVDEFLFSGKEPLVNWLMSDRESSPEFRAPASSNVIHHQVH